MVVSAGGRTRDSLGRTERMECRTPMVWSLLEDAMNIKVNVACPCRVFTFFVNDFLGAGSLKDASES